MVDDEVESPEKEKAPSSDDIFCALEKDVIKEATTFTYQWGKSESESVTWKIMQDSEFVIDNSVSYPIFFLTIFFQMLKVRTNFI
jgi:hypothetical protein